MKYNRRYFLKIAGTASAGLAFHSISNNAFAEEVLGGKRHAFGLQLYTLRDDLPHNPKGILKQVATAGYKQVESYEGPQGMFWGMNNKEFKKYLDGLGMKIISSHCDINKDFEKKIEQAAAIGMKYLICPWLGPQKSLDDFKKFAEQFNKCGGLCRKAGIKFAYHNHAYSFSLLEGGYPQDVLMKGTDASLVDFEMDIYWVITAGQDPLAWVKKYPDRFKLCHIKDRLANTTDESASCTLGTGIINYASILPIIKKQGMQYFVVEQERYDGTTPLQAIRDNAAFMRKIKF
ncbi:MAG TPA: sugar phosphate isomerase/epimerase [Chitinophagaceae bacterium]|nr:sugar phosphate isomerase/epimerase [Chitinophagaceae bacterium]